MTQESSPADFGASIPAVPELTGNFKTPLYEVPQAVALDFDRTLADNKVCMERLFRAVEGMPGISIEAIKAKQIEVQARGDTFDPLHFVQGALVPKGPDNSLCDEFAERFVRMKEPKVLYDDAERFLEMLQDADVPHLILTWGDNTEWQYLKLQAAGYPVSKKIMNTKSKGAQVQKYRRLDGKFHFHISYGGMAEYVADQMVLIDDKSISFDDFPAEYPGFKIIRGEELPSQKGPIGDNVQIIYGFDRLTVVDGVVRLRRNGDPAPDNKFARRRLWRDHEAVSRQQLHYLDRIAVYVPYGLSHAA